MYTYTNTLTLRLLHDYHRQHTQTLVFMVAISNPLGKYFSHSMWFHGPGQTGLKHWRFA